MLPNHEGFLHPLVDAEKCVECGACESVCPGLAPAVSHSNVGQAFIVQHKNDAVRYQSTSGGAFTAIAEGVIRRGGVVFGAVMTEDLIVKHSRIDSVGNLSQFRNSKYVQSEIGNCFKDAKALLQQGRWVCFSGTPCQINGLIKYLKEGFSTLLTVDVVCKSVPSPLVFKKYVEFKKEKEGQIADVVFRDKKRGFHYCTMAHYQSHSDRNVAKDIYRRGSESDEWLRLFLSGRISRRSCANCQYQTMERPSDFTLGDIWETGFKEFDDNKGSTLVHVWSEKGEKFIQDIQNEIRSAAFPIEKSRGANRVNTIKIFPERDSLFEDAKGLKPSEFFKKYAPNTSKIRIKELGRYLIWQLRLHDLVRHLKHSYIHRAKA